LGDNTFWSNTSLRQAIFHAGRSSAPIEKVVDRYPHAGGRRSVSSDAAGSSSAFTDPAASTGRPEDGSNPIRASTSIAVSIEAAGFNAPLAHDALPFI
jgi:hypothetical protein